ncbi:MAG TPA: helix-hairpin-helix domain-containing protein [Candidatus Acidoferrum sp.]|nr:helix-hairpin-helix domain-containing protein [Candidatus Acidoferrum sp.]
MHAWCTRTAVIVTALTLAPWTTLAADKPAKASSQSATVSATVGSEAKVNINTAGVKELTTLDGIRPKVAERIVAYREAHGPFKKPGDLKKVDGVGKAAFERNRERLVTK